VTATHRVVGWRKDHQVPGEEVQYLRQAVTSNGIVLIQAHGRGFMMEYGLLNILLDLIIQLFIYWGPVPAFLPGVLHPPNLTGTNGNGIVGLLLPRSANTPCKRWIAAPMNMNGIRGSRNIFMKNNHVHHSVSQIISTGPHSLTNEFKLFR
jgi:hypothetical protein